MPLLNAFQDEELERILHPNQATAPEAAPLGEQLGRGFLKGLSFGFYKPDETKPGGLPQTLADIAGSAVSFAPALLAGGAGIAGLAGRSATLAPRLLQAGRTAGEVVPAMMRPGLLAGIVPPGLLTKGGAAATYGSAAILDAAVRAKARGDAPSEAVKNIAFSAVPAALLGSLAGRAGKGVKTAGVQVNPEEIAAARTAAATQEAGGPVKFIPTPEGTAQASREAGSAGPFRELEGTGQPDLAQYSEQFPLKEAAKDALSPQELGLLPPPVRPGGEASALTPLAQRQADFTAKAGVAVERFVRGLSDEQVAGYLKQVGAETMGSPQESRQLLTDLLTQAGGPVMKGTTPGSVLPGENLLARGGGGGLRYPFPLRGISGASDIEINLARIRAPEVRNGVIEVNAPVVEGRPIGDPGAVPLDQPPDAAWVNQLVRAWRGFVKELPAEERLRRARPESAAITEFERHRVNLEKTLLDLHEGKIPGVDIQAVRALSHADVEALEQRAVDVWNQLGRTPEAMTAAMQVFPEGFRNVLQHIRELLPQANEARAVMGLDPIEPWEGPYIPRLVKALAQQIDSPVKGFQGLGDHLQQTIRSFQMTREMETMLEGRVKNGIEYAPAANSVVRYLWETTKLIETSKLMQSLEQNGVLFRSWVDAARVSPNAQGFEILGLPGTTSQRWWTATEPERDFIVQNMQQGRGMGKFSSFTSWSNLLFRNPNLFNPIPHFLKNMGYKFGLSGGDVLKLSPAMTEYFKGADPEMIRRFKEVMPFTESGQTAEQILQEMLVRDGVKAAAYRVTQLVGQINKPSSKAIFAYLDPAMRYARWKQYVAEGLNDQEAANHTWVDLVRYGTRSDLVDWWKSIPLNFFVPWRTGTVTSVTKQLLDHPLRAAMIIGGVDYLREINYRKTGRWVHLPIDYIEGPIAQALQAESTSDMAKGLVGMTVGTYLFGPGGGFVANQLADAIKATGGTPEWNRVGNMFWGWQFFGGGFDEFKKFQQDQNPMHFMNIMKSALIGEHSALTYSPRRFSKFLPDWLPGMGKVQVVRDAEAAILNKQARGIRTQADKLMAEGKIQDAAELLGQFNRQHGTMITPDTAGIRRMRTLALAAEHPDLARYLLLQRLIPGVPVPTGEE